MSKSDNKKWLIGAGILTGAYAVLDIIGKKNKAKNAMDIDDGNPYLDSASITNESDDDIETPADSDAIREPEPVIPDNFYVAHGKWKTEPLFSNLLMSKQKQGCVLAPFYPQGV